jgi:hypothetical protein
MAQTFIQSADIGTGEILETNLGSGAVTAAKIANATITATQIANTTITASQIASATITATQIANQTITGTQIANTTITGDQIASNAVSAAKADLTGAWNFSNLQGTLGANLAANSNKVTGLATPTADADAATKLYVDTAVQKAASGLDVKASCVVATTGPLPTNTYANGTGGVGATLTGDVNEALPSIDGVTPTVNMRILVKNEATAADNGIYDVTTVGDGGTKYVLTRATDFNDAASITPNAFTFIEQGTAQADSQWVLTTNGPITVGTTSLTFSQFGAALVYTAGNGLSLTSGTFSVKVNTSATGGIVNAVDVTSNGVAVKVDNSTIAGDGSGNLQIKGAGVDFAQLSNNVKAAIGKWDGNAVFTGNGSTTVFTIPGSLTDVANGNNGIQVSVNGVIKLRGAGNDYTSDANGAITFSVAPANNASIQVYYGRSTT